MTFVLRLAAVATLALLLAGCGGKKRTTAHLPTPPPPAPSTAPIEVPKDARVLWTETGLASWYGPPYHNRRGANGEVYDMNAPTAAHRTLPLGSIVRVTNVKSGAATIVRITDRGPFIEGRIIDLSLAAAKAVDVWRPGVAKVRVDVLEAPKEIERGGRWCVQVGAFDDRDAATELKQRLARRYQTAKVIQFTGPTGEWVRIRVQGDDKRRAEQVIADNKMSAPAWLVRLD